MIYGIDLGTTNSLIGVNGNLISSLVPSVANVITNEAGDSEYENPDALRSFKTGMSMGDEGKMSRIGSSIVLAKLKALAGVKGMMQAIITVPADFDDNQRKATIKAAEDVGIEVVQLVNEPTAAAIYISGDTRALSVVFDLGGGTFDVSIIDNRFGIYDVQASYGDSHCGGDDLDKAIMQFFIDKLGILTYKLNKAERLELLHYCTKLKVQMCTERKTIKCDFSKFGITRTVNFTEDQYISLMKQTFGKCLEMTKRIVNKEIEFGSTYNLCFVGGSSKSPQLKEWITKELGNPNVPTNFNPDTVVAQGAVMFAGMVESGTVDSMVVDITKAISVVQNDGICRLMIEDNSRIPCSTTELFTVSRETNYIEIELAQGSAYLVKDNSVIGTLRYDFDHTAIPNVDYVFLTVTVVKGGIIKFSCRELSKEPKEVLINMK